MSNQEPGDVQRHRALRIGSYNLDGKVGDERRRRDQLKTLAQLKLTGLGLQFSDQVARRFPSDLRINVADTSATLWNEGVAASPVLCWGVVRRGEVGR